jgi:hypothetical protein
MQHYLDSTIALALNSRRVEAFCVPLVGLVRVLCLFGKGKMRNSLLRPGSNDTGNCTQKRK